MGTHFIREVLAVRDCVDRLESKVRVSTDFYGILMDRAFVLRWNGRAAFYKESVAANSIPGPQHPKRTLPARWTNQECAAMMVPGEASLELACDLPGDALDRLEEFRQSGRLFVRFEGQLALIFKKSSEQGADPWLTDLRRAMEGTGRVPAYDLRTEPLELTRDVWGGQILATLRPPGRFILEVQVAAGSPIGEAAARALTHLADARRAFDEGRYPEVARTCYQALDELNALRQRAEDRYGRFGADRLADQIKAVKSVCNPARHGDQPQHDGLEIDRLLAQHILTLTQSLAGVVLR